MYTRSSTGTTIVGRRCQRLPEGIGSPRNWRQGGEAIYTRSRCGWHGKIFRSKIKQMTWRWEAGETASGRYSEEALAEDH